MLFAKMMGSELRNTPYIIQSIIPNERKRKVLSDKSSVRLVLNTLIVCGIKAPVVPIAARYPVKSIRVI